MTTAEKIERLNGALTPDNVDEILRQAGELDRVDDEAAVLLEGLLMRAEAMRTPEGREAFEQQERERAELEEVARRHGR